jgi:hypothetical protein
MRLSAARRCAFVGISVLTFGGCALGGEKTEASAVIVQPTAASRAELQNAVNAGLGMKVTLADDALTKRNTLTIERNALRDSSGQRIEVREREAPEMFHLMKRGDQCVLIHERTKQETILRETQCVAE